MSSFGPSFWDARFADPEPAYGTTPSLYLQAHSTLPHRDAAAFVPGDGGGRNGVWLAKQGFRVISCDFSQKGLDRAQTWAAQNGVAIETILADLTTWTFPTAQFDLVASIYVHLPPAHRERVHRALLHALKPGGRLVLEAFHTDQMNYTSGGPRDPDLLMTEERLRRDFAEGRILELRHEVVTLDESALHRGPASLVRMLVERIQ